MKRRGSGEKKKRNGENSTHTEKKSDRRPHTFHRRRESTYQPRKKNWGCLPKEEEGVNKHKDEVLPTLGKGHISTDLRDETGEGKGTPCAR